MFISLTSKSCGSLEQAISHWTRVAKSIVFVELAYFYNVATFFFLVFFFFKFDILNKLYLTEVLVLKYFAHYTLPMIVLLDDEFCE